MSEKPEEEVKNCAEEVQIPEEIRIKYFPTSSSIPTYDVLPLFEVEDYKKRIAHELSFLENPEYAAKWQKFREGLPGNAKDLAPPTMTSNEIHVFSNYGRRKVAKTYYDAYVGPPSPQAIFHKK